MKPLPFGWNGTYADPTEVIINVPVTTASIQQRHTDLQFGLRLILDFRLDPNQVPPYRSYDSLRVSSYHSSTYSVTSYPYAYPCLCFELACDTVDRLLKMDDESKERILSPSAASCISRLQLPSTCDPPGPQNPSKQSVWVVSHLSLMLASAAVSH